jgi:hypothetical protein
VTHVVEVDVALDPADVGLLRVIGIVFALSCDSTGGGWHPFAKLRTSTDLIQELLGTVLFHGLTPSFDRKGFWVYNVVIAGPAQQPALPFGSQIL